MLNKTNPPVSVKIETNDIGDKKVARIHVPKSRQLVSTSEGLLQHPRLMANGPDNRHRLPDNQKFLKGYYIVTYL